MTQAAMVLCQPDIRKAVKAGRIIFDPPLEEDQWGEASVDLRLGRSFTKLKNIEGVKISVAGGLQSLGESGFWQTVDVPEDDGFGNRSSITLRPNDFVLVPTYEKVKIPNDLIGLIEGRSTYARLGLTMHQTAPWIQPGWSGPDNIGDPEQWSVDDRINPSDRQALPAGFPQIEPDASKTSGLRCKDFGCLSEPNTPDQAGPEDAI
jgi:deoxycytidine triphosphate deaminase